MGSVIKSLVVYSIGFFILFLGPLALSDLHFWKKAEIELNDLEFNSSLFHQLPSREELQNYQTHYLYRAEVPLSKLGVLGNRDFLKDFLSPEGYLYFYIHPRATFQFVELLKNIKITQVPADPTSSPRTFFINDDWMVKVSLPFVIQKGLRTLYPLQMQRAIAVNDLLQELDGFNFLPEPLALYDLTPQNPFGLIFRKIPDRVKQSGHTLVPLLSYVAREQGESLLARDAKAHHMSKEEFALKKILPKLIEHFRQAASIGVVLEAHQQNILLELDEDHFFAHEIWSRDLDGARIDFDLRRQIGFDDRAFLENPEAHWIFDLENMGLLKQKLKFPILKRPQYWSGPLEKSLQNYLLGSSVDLLQRASHSNKLISAALELLNTNSPSMPEGLYLPQSNTKNIFFNNPLSTQSANGCFRVFLR